jgi:hypothetical protein
MAERAHVSSVDALDVFRARLIVYVSQARPVLEEVSSDVLRTRLWLENEQRTYWENQARRRTKELEQAQQALFSAKLGTLRQESAAEQMAYHRARRALDEADNKLRVLKRWTRELDGRAQPLVKQMEKMHTLLANDLTKAVASLNQTIATLSAYAEIAPPSAIGDTSSALGQKAQPEVTVPAVEKGGGAK